MKLVDKFKAGIKENRKYIIIMVVLWIVLSIVLIAPLAQSIVDSTTEAGKYNLTKGVENFIADVVSFSSITKIFGEQYIETFFTTQMYFTIIYIIAAVIGFVKSKAKGNYYDIEHGSSDWSEHGEQYTILSKNKGLILAEDNYLPLDKRGNLNTLIVGRFWFW